MVVDGARQHGHGESGSPGKFLIDEDVPAYLARQFWKKDLVDVACDRPGLQRLGASLHGRFDAERDRGRLRVVEVLARPLDLTPIDASLLEAAGQGARPSARAQQNHDRGGGHL
jgi:hypothetical protein